MKRVKLIIDKIPMRFKGNYTWYEKGDEFEVVEEKEMKLVGLSYKLKYAGCVFEGWFPSNNFKETLR